MKHNFRQTYDGIIQVLQNKTWLSQCRDPYFAGTSEIGRGA